MTSAHISENEIFNKIDTHTTQLHKNIRIVIIYFDLLLFIITYEEGGKRKSGLLQSQSGSQFFFNWIRLQSLFDV